MPNGKEDLLPWFPLWAAEIRTSEDCRVMTHEEFGVYMELLIIAWCSRPQATLPNDLTQLRALLGNKVSARRFKKIWEKVGQKFEKDDKKQRLFNKKQAKILADQQRKIDAMRKAGRKGAKKRWGANGHPNGDPNAIAIASRGERTEEEDKSEKERQLETANIVLQEHRNPEIPSNAAWEHIKELAQIRGILPHPESSPPTGANDTGAGEGSSS